MPTYKVKDNESEKRIDVVLSANLDVSRAKIQKLIKVGEITLNNESIKPNTLVNAGDEIYYPTLLMQSPAPKKGPAPILDIVFQNDDLLVIEKPAGLIVHQATPQDTNTNVVDGLLELYPEIADVGDDPTRPGIVHRLDKDVSGVMVIAKTQEMFEDLKNQFKERQTKKEYLALAYGNILRDADEINLKIARSKARGRMVARPDSQEGKEAVTRFEVIERYKTATYVRVFIITGRTHQIRVHFKAIDHPLVGDKLYGKRSMKHIRPIELGRIFLHAHKLTIRLADGSVKNFVSQLPNELADLLSKLPKE